MTRGLAFDGLLRWLRFAYFVLGFVALSGCREDPVVLIRNWTVSAPADVAGVDIEIPSHRLEHLIPMSIPFFKLKSHISVPEAFRGKLLTLAILHFEGCLELRADGQEAPSLEDLADDVNHHVGPHRFRIPEHLADDGELELELIVRNTWHAAHWFNYVPRLSATPAGDAQIVRISRANDMISQVGFWTAFPYALAQVLLFLVGRRPVHAWFALGGVCISAYPAFALGISQTLFGRYEFAILNAATAIAVYAGTRGTYLLANFGRPPRFFGYVVLLAVCSDVLLVRDTSLWQVVTLTGVTLLIKDADDVRCAVRLYRQKPQPLELWCSVLCAPVLSLPSLPDFLVPVTFEASVFGGLRLAPLAVSVVVLVQSAAISLTYTNSLGQLNRELGKRVDLLQSRTTEVHRLNIELRRQVAARAEEIADAFAQTAFGTVPFSSLVRGDVVAGRYSVVGEIGSGAAGSVYEVERIADAAHLALKALRVDDAPAALARFAREAQVACSIRHANVIEVTDIDVAAQGFLFFVMELVRGTDLRAARPNHGDVPWVIEILAQVAAGLVAIHKAGAVHRDLKPANILLADEGSSTRVKIADFGIAMLDRSQADPSAAHAILTMTGHSLGTPMYMAPEILSDARKATPAADVFSFGVIAYELLSGRAPHGEIPLAYVLGAAVETTIPSLEVACPHVPRALAEIVYACLALKPEGRPSAEDLARFFERARRRNA